MAACSRFASARPRTATACVLIAGERRSRAAVKAAVMELLAIIRPAGAGDEEEQSGLLVEALIENDLRRNLDPVARARGYSGCSSPV